MFLCFICMRYRFSDLTMLSLCAGIMKSFQQNTSEAQSTPFKSTPAMPQSNSPFNLSPTPTVFEQTEKKAGGFKFSEGKANMFPDRSAGSVQRPTGAPVQSQFGFNTNSSMPGNRLTFPAAIVSASSSPLSSTSLASVSTLPTPSSRSLPSSPKDSGTYILCPLSISFD